MLFDVLSSSIFCYIEISILLKMIWRLRDRWKIVYRRMIFGYWNGLLLVFMMKTINFRNKLWVLSFYDASRKEEDKLRKVVSEETAF